MAIDLDFEIDDVGSTIYRRFVFALHPVFFFGAAARFGQCEGLSGIAKLPHSRPAAASLSD